MRNTVLGLLLGSGLAACTPAETTVSVLVEKGPFAVTASSAAALTSRTCRKYAFDKTGHVGNTDTVCSNATLELGEAWVDDPALFELAMERSAVVFTALAPGVTTLHLREAGAANGEVFDAKLEARRARRVQVDFGCDGGTLTVVAESKFTFSVKTFDGDLELIGVPKQPLHSTVLSLVDRGATLLASATPGVGTITSDHDPALNIAVRVFAVSEATLEVPAPTLDKWGVGTASFSSSLLIDGRHACIDKTAHRVEVLTPAVCNLGQDSQGQVRQAVETYARSEVVARGTKGSACQLRFSIKDHPETAVERTHTF